jgi:hypothetical protein
MKLTKIRNIDGTKLEQSELITIGQSLVAKLAKAGFITEYEVKGATSMKLGLHRRSFKINVAQLGYNAVIGIHVKSKKGYKRTHTPTWEQREEYNHIVNAVLDKFQVCCNIKSGPYIVRNYDTGAVKEWECVNYMGFPAEPDATYNGLGQCVDQLMTEKEAIELCAPKQQKQSNVKLVTNNQ